MLACMYAWCLRREKRLLISWNWGSRWCGKQRQEDDLREFEACRDYIARLCLKTKQSHKHS